MRIFLKGLIYGVFAGVIALAVLAVPHIPAIYKPWAPLSEEQGIGPFTQVKIRALQQNPPACHDALNAQNVFFDILNDRTAGNCALNGQVFMKQSLYPYSAPVSGSCPMITALALWEKYILAPAAENHLQTTIETITHYGIFSCRNVRGSTARRSQHATANAIDIAGFRTADGRHITVLAHWGTDTPEGDFLRAVHQGACSLFSGVLGPEYNRLHADHFHFDMGPYHICR